MECTWRKFRSYDHGYTAPACCKWYAMDNDGRIWAYRELYVTGMDAENIGKEIVRLSKGENINYTVADSSIFARTGFSDKWGNETIAAVLARTGVECIPGSKDRIAGWNTVRRYLKWDEKSPPMMIHFTTCENSIRTYPKLIHDTRKPEDLDTRGEEHAQDADRYFLMTLHDNKDLRPVTELERKMEEYKDQHLRQSLKEIYEDQITYER